MAELFDRREQIFRDALSIGQDYEQYISGGTATQIEKFRLYEGKIELGQTELATISSWRRKLNVLVFSGLWCGDCARQCPMIAKIAGKNALVTLRFLDNREHANIADEFRIHGASRVPTAIFISEDFFELARFGDRTYSHYKRKVMREAGPSCDAGLGVSPVEELQEELREWLAIFDRVQCLLHLSPMLRERYGD
jgi:thiol-disulfide isomerase/thioredoxin